MSPRAGIIQSKRYLQGCNPHKKEILFKKILGKKTRGNKLPPLFFTYISVVSSTQKFFLATGYHAYFLF
jgi:hypothetical protein